MLKPHQDPAPLTAEQIRWAARLLVFIARTENIGTVVAHPDVTRLVGQACGAQFDLEALIGKKNFQRVLKCAVWRKATGCERHVWKKVRGRK